MSPWPVSTHLHPHPGPHALTQHSSSSLVFSEGSPQVHFLFLNLITPCTTGYLLMFGGGWGQGPREVPRPSSESQPASEESPVGRLHCLALLLSLQ